MKSITLKNLNSQISSIFSTLSFLLLLLTLSLYFIPLATAQSAIGCWVTQVGEPGSNVNVPKCTTNDLGIPEGSVDGACTPTGEYPSDLAKSLNDDYGITLQGYDAEHIRYIYDLFRCLSGTRFGSLVYGTELTNGKTVIDGVETIGMNCPESGPCGIWITQMPGRGTTFKFILTHELGHVISYQNSREVAHWTEVENAFNKEGGISLYARAGLSCNGESSQYEDYAEMIAYFLHPHAGETTPACDPDKSPPNPFFELKQFPDHLDAAKKILLP